MKEYKRLTKRNEEFGIIALCRSCSRYAICPKDEECVACIDEEQERLAELEDKIENGTLIELPCKIDDIVYEAIKGLPIREWRITGIVYGRPYGKNYVITAERIRDMAHWKFWCEDFGKTLFLTREEAEAKLKELQEKDNDR